MIIARLPGVYEVYMVTGKYDLLVKIRGKSIEDIGKIVIDRIRVLKGVSQTFTSACFETIKEDF
ncbi:Lrp/AsnC family transcriptional regulator [Thermoplasmatota archaeon]